MRQLMEVKPEWLLEAGKHYFTEQEVYQGADKGGKKLPKGQGAAGASAATAGR